jgi:hypothetical protein
MPLIERISVVHLAPEKENLFAFVKGDLVFLRDWPSDVDMEADISERNTWNATLDSGRIVKGDIFQNIKFDVGFDRQIISWRLPIVSQFGMRNERISALFERLDRSFHSVQAYVGAQCRWAVSSAPSTRLLVAK